MICSGHDKEIVLLTANETAKIADVINESTGREVQIKLISPDGFVQSNGTNEK